MYLWLNRDRLRNRIRTKVSIRGDILYIATHALCNKKQSITFTGHLKYALHVPCPWEQIHGLNLFQRIPLFTQELSIAGGGGGVAADHDEGAWGHLAVRVEFSQPVRGGSTTITSGWAPALARRVAASPASMQ